MTKTSAKVFLIVFGNLLIFAVSGGIFGVWLVTGWSIGLVGLILGIAHIAVSAANCRRFEHKFDITRGKYILYSAMPAFVISLLLLLASLLIVGTAMSVFGDIVAVLLFIAMFPAVYSVIYLIVLAGAVSFF